MTFPQLSSVAPLLGGQQYFRLLTDLSSAGDIYESEVSALGFALGPSSDLRAVRVSFYDPTLPGGVSQFRLSPERNLSGRVDSRVGDPYIRSRSRRGRILISIDDIYSPQWRPGDFDPNVLTGDLWRIIPPTLDVLQYFKTLPSVVPPRSDRPFHFNVLESPPGANKRTFLAIPAYGRKSGSIAIRNDTGVLLDIAIDCVRFALSTNAAGTTYLGVEGNLVAPAAIANGANVLFSYNASTHGEWDYLIFQVGGANPYNGGIIQIHANLSDDR